MCRTWKLHKTTASVSKGAFNGSIIMWKFSPCSITGAGIPQRSRIGIVFGSQNLKEKPKGTARFSANNTMFSCENVETKSVKSPVLFVGNHVYRFSLW